jgi:hypothetical protein
MTPNERAYAALDACDCNSDKCMLDRIASAISAAENDALERAAERVLATAGIVPDIEPQSAREALCSWMADRIRSLKSQQEGR